MVIFKVRNKLINRLLLMTFINNYVECFDIIKIYKVVIVYILEVLSLRLYKRYMERNQILRIDDIIFTY